MFRPATTADTFTTLQGFTYFPAAAAGVGPDGAAGTQQLSEQVMHQRKRSVRQLQAITQAVVGIICALVLDLV
jgi:hypothetical protein